MARRELVFEDVSRIMPDVRRLHDGPHATLGNWSLAQICKHLADSFEGSMKGFDLRNHRWKRWFLRRRMLHYAFTKGIPRNTTVDPKLTPPSDVDLEAAVSAMAGAIERYVSYRGKLRAHPLFGRMSREVWDRVHCVHCPSSKPSDSPIDRNSWN